MIPFYTCLYVDLGVFTTLSPLRLLCGSLLRAPLAFGLMAARPRRTIDYTFFRTLTSLVITIDFVASKVAPYRILLHSDFSVQNKILGWNLNKVSRKREMKFQQSWILNKHIVNQEVTFCSRSVHRMSGYQGYPRSIKNGYHEKIDKI